MARYASARHKSLSESDLHANRDTNCKPENTRAGLDALTASAPINGHTLSVGPPHAMAKVTLLSPVDGPFTVDVIMRLHL